MTSALFIARTAPGFQLDAARDPRVRAVRKRALRVSVHFASAATTLATREGRIAIAPGDAIIDDGHGHQWGVARAHFDAKYAPVAPGLPGDACAYTSLPTEARAMQMSTRFRVRFADGVSELDGSPGDWLVDYGDGSLGVVSATVFADSYDLA
jgi:hypothetical protein